MNALEKMYKILDLTKKHEELIRKTGSTDETKDLVCEVYDIWWSMSQEDRNELREDECLMTAVRKSLGLE